mgnify:CR=1 FL=1|jgi:flagellar hook protein FlgE
MVRSMYSGVAGMKANQNRMDVIGNNIANSNTYGFKSGRATFRDVYYQQFRGASAGTQTRGGINPSSIGYGAQLSSIDLMMDSSSMTSTGFALDCAITGEGFFQVMDPDGNIYYTKAGMLDINPATGALVDSNGNFVLGTSATDGKLDSTQPGQNKIIIEVDSVQASTAKVSQEIGGRTITIESTEQTKDANISFTFTEGTDMPDGQKVQIVRDSTSSLYNVKLNANETFESMAELTQLINQAITEHDGTAHPGGNFNFTIEPDPFETLGPLTGTELVKTPTVDYEGGGLVEFKDPTGATQPGSWPPGFKYDSVGLRFSGAGAVGMEVQHVDADPTATPPQEEGFKVIITTAGDATANPPVAAGTYEGFISKKRSDASQSGGTVLLKNTAAGADPNDTITIAYPTTKQIANYDDDGNFVDLIPELQGGAIANLSTASPNQPTKKCGWGKSTLTLTGGTEFHTQDVSNLTGISIGADGVISGTSDAGLQVLGRIDLATFANAKGLEQCGNSYFAETANSGEVKLAIAGESGTGAIKNSALEMSNVDLAQEFADMIVTQRGFQASSRMITVSDTMLEELTNLKR